MLPIRLVCAAVMLLAPAFADEENLFFRKNSVAFVAGTTELRADGARLGALRLRFHGKYRAIQPEGREEMRMRLCTFARHSSLPSIRETTGYARVVYPELWPGMDLEFYYRAGRIEYDVVAHPGSHLADAELRFEGAASLEVQADGSLAIHSSGVTALSTRPIAWTEREGSRWSLPARYRKTGKQTVALDVDGWDGQSRLRIDPAIVLSTSAGASLSDHIGSALNYDYYRVTNPLARQGALIMDHNGAAVFAGQPDSNAVRFSTVAGSGAGYAGDRSFLAQRTVSSFTGALFNMDSQITALAEDPAGGYLVAGTVMAGQLATTAGAYRAQALGTADGFLLRVRSDFSKVDYATYLGFSPSAMTIDSSRQVYIAGQTTNGQPYSTGAYRSPSLGKGDIAVLKLASDFKTVRYAAIWGGSDSDEATSISVDSQGGAVVGGLTLSPDLPIPAGAYASARQKKTQSGPLPSGFIMRLSADGTSLVGATYLAGSSYDEVRMAQVLPTGDVLALGITRSSDFPALGRPLGPVADGIFPGLHGFALRLDAKLAHAAWSQLLSNVALADAALVPDDHFCFAVTPFHVPPSADAYLGSKAPINSTQGMSLIELDVSDGRLVYSGGLGRFSYAAALSVPFVAAGAGGLVGVVGTANPSPFPLAGDASLEGFYYPNTFVQVFRFGDTAPVPAMVSVRGLSPNAPAVDGLLQFPLTRRNMTVKVASSPAFSWLTLDSSAIAPPGALAWHMSPTGLTPGHYVSNVPLAASGGTVQPGAASFEMWVDTLRPSPAEIVLSAPHGQIATVTLRVAARSGLAFTIASDQPWIQSGGPAAVSPAEIAFQFPTADLDPGSYTGSIKLTPNGVTADSVSVPVRLTVN